MAFDDQDWGAWEALWTEDTVFVAAGKELKGLATVKEFMMSCLPPGYVSKHLCGPSVIEIDEDGRHAHAITHVVWVAANFKPQIVARHVDTFEKRDGRWLIARREEHPVPFRDGPTPMSDISAALHDDIMPALDRD